MSRSRSDETITFPDRYTLIGADFSLNRPGFAKLRIEKTDGASKIVSLETMNIDNKTCRKNKTRGEILCEIADALRGWIPQEGNVLLVREASVNNAAFGRRSGTAARTAVSEVAGVADLVAWQTRRLEWDEIYPTSVKLCLTGSGKGDKARVAEALPRYVGEHVYACDDESDATAVAVAYLIRNHQLSATSAENTAHSEDE